MGSSRRGATKSARAGGAGGEKPPRVGETVEVEVDYDGVISWRPAEVREALRGQRFICCVDGDEVRTHAPTAITP